MAKNILLSVFGVLVVGAIVVAYPVFFNGENGGAAAVNSLGTNVEAVQASSQIGGDSTLYLLNRMIRRIMTLEQRLGIPSGSGGPNQNIIVHPNCREDNVGGLFCACRIECESGYFPFSINEKGQIVYFPWHPTGQTTTSFSDDQENCTTTAPSSNDATQVCFKTRLFWPAVGTGSAGSGGQ